jgi:hypothetical protein
MRPLILRPLFATFALLLLLTPTAQADWKGQEADKDGVLHIMNPAEPAEAARTLSPEQLWQVGGDDDSDVMFGVLTQITSDRAGNIYLLDAQLHEVMIFSPDGEYVRSIGREGEGPGEFRRPADLFLTADGNVAVMQRMPGKIVVMTPEGEPVGVHPVPEARDRGMRMFFNGRYAGEQVVLAAMEMARDESGFRTKTILMGVNPQGEQTAVFYTHDDERNFANMEFDEKTFGRGPLVWAPASDGRVFVSDNFDTYSIKVYNGDGSMNRVVERAYEHRVRSAEERERNKPRIMFRRRGGGAQTPKTIASKTDRDIQEMYPRASGSLWVLSSKGAYDGGDDVIATFDVYDPDGKFTQQVTLKGSGSYVDDGFHVVGDYLYVVTGLRSARAAMFGGEDDEEELEEEPEPMGVICYNIGEIMWTEKRP